MSGTIEVEDLRQAIVQAMRVRKSKMDYLEYQADDMAMFVSVSTKEVCDLRLEMDALDDLWKLLNEVCDA